MTTAHNEHTGASMTTAGKGGLEKYAQGFPLRGWDAIFKPKKNEFVGEYSWTLENGSTVSFKGDPNGYAEWTSFAEPATTLPSAVMALDFHDSQPVKASPVHFNSEEDDGAREAWEDAWRDAVMRQPFSVSSLHTATNE